TIIQNPARHDQRIRSPPGPSRLESLQAVAVTVRTPIRMTQRVKKTGAASGAVIALMLHLSGCIAPPARPPRLARAAPALPADPSPEPEEVGPRLVEAHNRVRAEAGLP